MGSGNAQGGAELEPKSKTEPPGLGFWPTQRGGGLLSGRGDPIWQAYTGFEVLGWCDRAMREEGLSWSQNPKQSRRVRFWPTKHVGICFRGEGALLG